MLANRRLVPALVAALTLAALALGVSSCGYTNNSKDVAEGEAVNLGELQIIVTFSRYLNPSDNEDSAYLVGQPPLSEGLSYFGVFVEIQNKSEKVQHVPSMELTEADGTRHSAFPSESLYALQLGEEVEPQEQIPVLDSTAQQGPIEGSLVLFRLPEKASANRPLTLHIQPAEGEEAKVTLDL